jgi:hypothetical protein
MGFQINQFRQQLVETIQWCDSQFKLTDPKRSLRSQYLRVREDMHACFRKTANANRVVDELVQKRRIKVGDPSSIKLSRKNMLVFCPKMATDDGLASEATSGFFDVENYPPWDTWFFYSPQRFDCLFCWIPDCALDLARAGVDQSMGDCLFWLTDYKSFLFRSVVKIPDEFESTLLENY